MADKLSFIWRSFDSISKTELYDVANLRQKVFIIEQKCFYEDLDYFDQDAKHLLLYSGKNLIGYSRVFPPGIKYDSSSIGRIVVDKQFRGKGYGIKITLESIEFIKRNFPKTNISISAQYRLLKYYENLNFVKEGNVYLEDDIEHIKMVLKVSK